MRVISLNMRQAINSRYSGEVGAILITLSHPEIAGTAYVSTDNATLIDEGPPRRYGTVSLGINYLFCPMVLVLPDDKDEAPPAARIEISNVTRDLVTLARSKVTPGVCSMKLVMASTPDITEIPYADMDISGYQLNAGIISFEFSNSALDTEAFPGDLFTPSGFQGVFK